MARAFDPAGAVGQLAVLASPVTAAPLTITCWFRPHFALANGTMVSIGATGNDTNYILLRQLSTGAVSMQVNAGTADTISTTALAVDLDRSWHFASAVLRTATDRSVYLDAAGRINTAISKVPALLAAVAIGSRRGLTASIGGTPNIVAEVCVWDIDLTDGELKQLYRGADPFTVRPGRLVGYWPLRPDATALRDFSRSGNHLAIETGSTWRERDRPVRPLALNIFGTVAGGPANVTGAAALTGTGTLAGTGQRTRLGAASLAGTGALAAAGVAARIGAAALSGLGTLSVTLARAHRLPPGRITASPSATDAIPAPSDTAATVPGVKPAGRTRA